ncbi:MAG: hypothetical protein K1060chlam3_00843 [Candidatus Anoxychlamydiales bacterium]|nr:hypothetical protein [Candidatus Anoxychlamydiales bacterium]
MSEKTENILIREAKNIDANALAELMNQLGHEISTDIWRSIFQST